MVSITTATPILIVPLQRDGRVEIRFSIRQPTSSARVKSDEPSSTTRRTSNRYLHLQLHEVSQCAHDLDDLLRKLTGGCEHERLALDRGNVDLLKD